MGDPAARLPVAKDLLIAYRHLQIVDVFTEMRSDFPVNDALVLKAGYLIEFHAQSILVNIVCVCARIGNLLAKMRGYLMSVPAPS